MSNKNCENCGKDINKTWSPTKDICENCRMEERKNSSSNISEVYDPYTGENQ